MWNVGETSTFLIGDEQRMGQNLLRKKKKTAEIQMIFSPSGPTLVFAQLLPPLII